MKPFTLFMCLLSFLILEAGFVSYVPLSEWQKRRYVQSVPYVSHWITWQDHNAVRNVFRSGGQGFVSYKWRDENQTWTDAESLISESLNGSRHARLAVKNVRQQGILAQFSAELKEKADNGDLFAAIGLFQLGAFNNSPADSSLAADFLKKHPSALAAWTLKSIRGKGLTMDSLDTQLLFARLARENLRHPQMKDEHYDQVSARYAVHLAEVRKSATNGDPDAIWIVEQLDATPVWRPEDS